MAEHGEDGIKNVSSTAKDGEAPQKMLAAEAKDGEAPQQEKDDEAPQQEQKPGTGEITPPTAEKAPETAVDQLPMPPEPVSEEKVQKPSSHEPVSEEKVEKPSPAEPVSEEKVQKPSPSEPVSEEKVQEPSPPEPVSEEKVQKPSSPTEASSSIGKEEKGQKGAGEKSRARLLWDRLHDAVRGRFHCAKTKTPLTPEEDKGSQKKEDEKPHPAGRGTESMADGQQTDAAVRSQSMKKLQRAIKLVQRLMSWYNRHRSPTEEGKDGETTTKQEGARADLTMPPGRDRDEGDHPQEEAEPERRAGGGQPDAATSCPVNKLQRAVRKVLWILSWYNRHRSSRRKDDEPSGPAPAQAEDDKKDDKATAEDEDGKPLAAEEDGNKDSKPPAGQETEETKRHHKWKEEEKRLEKILEEAFTRLLVPEYKRQLNATKRKCLLTFSVFDLDSKVKKQAMIYWWVAQFHLPYHSGLTGKNEDKLDGEGIVAKICSPFRLPYHRRSSDLPNKPGKNSSVLPGTTTAAPAAGNDLPAAPPDQATHDDKKPHAEGGIVSKLPSLGFMMPHRRSGDHLRNKPAKNSAAPGNAAAQDDGDAEKVLIKLSDLGFIEPIKNYCCGVIHGCKVNPLVHWMVKLLAKDDRFADLDEDGRPTTKQTTSGILCLTAGYRNNLQKRRIAELQTGNVPKRTPSSKEESTQAKNEPSRVPSTKSTTKAAEIMGNKDAASMEKTKSKTMREPSLPRQKEVEEQTQIIENNDMTSVEQTTKSKAERVPSLPRQTKVEEQTQVKDEQIEEIKGKQVILNVDAHVYPLSKSLFEHLSDSLTMLQLGRWCHHDNKTYMEVDGLESLCAINKLRNIRYLSLRGLSRLSKLPCGVDKLKSLEILDMRGCQNLVTIAENDLPLKCLTHLDLTECYMLEYIGRGITSLTNLQVFKGFVFGSGTQGNTGCRIRDLNKLNKLQKLTVSITTDANIREGDLAELKNLTKLRSLTITWSEIPSILEDGGSKIKKKREELLKIWTSFELPQVLEKLDLRCYPKKFLELRNDNRLQKLYLRGGELEKFCIPDPNFIKILRLRYLKNFKMIWAHITAMLKEIERVEIRVKDEKLLEHVVSKENDNVVSKENDKKDFVEDLNKELQMKETMDIPTSTLDENGIWIKDNKEVENRQGIINQSITSKRNGDAKKKTGAHDAPEMRKGSSSGPSESPNTEDTTTTLDANKDIGN